MTAVVTSYVQSLRSELPGPRRARSELLAELRDGLNDAADAYQAKGLCRADAEQKAVAEAGEPSELVREYREVLAGTQGRRTAALFALSQLASIVIWDKVWKLPGPTGAVVDTPQPPGAMLCWRLIDWAGGISGVAAVLCLALLVIGARRGWTNRHAIIGQAVVGGAAVVTVMTCSVIGNALNGPRAEAMIAGSPVISMIGSLSALIALWQLAWCWRSIRLAQFA